MNIPERFDGRFVRFMAGVMAPGAVALMPWLLVAGKAYPNFGLWLFAGSALPVATLALAVFCAGMVLENIGSRLEVRLDQAHQIDEEAWHAYLNQTQGSLIGHGYISSLVTRLKFELGMSFALPVAAFGIAALAFCQNGMPHVPASFLITVALFAAWYFRNEAAQTVNRLNKTRRVLRSPM
jgi:hypothetical protein